MLWRVRSSRGRPRNAPAAFIQPCRPTVALRPPRGPGWVHELKHDGYRLQVHVRDGRVRLYTMNAIDWTKRYPLIVQDGAADFDLLHSRLHDQRAVALAFDLLMRDGDDLRRKPLGKRKAALRKLVRRSSGGIQYVEHQEGDGEEMFAAVCKLGLEGIVCKRLDAPYRSGPSRSWLKVKNAQAPAAMRVRDGSF